ncbi:uncharacterized protein LOC105833059 [Monomorium pharaonis]|uniref:uncharacterized protein LOC105833059 n=1 Tax=Monomorium pharaonis TaxID=307658 RepID=UPI00063EF61C|nr:uncharacterized protein LOC105833059 [Monomorium pharaonis]
MTGPNLLPPLPEIFLRWRQHRYVLATDVEKMFWQIVVHPDDRDLQRILWRDAATDIVEYRLDTVTYGLACAPYLAMRTLHQLADDERERYPHGAAVLERDVYMDDVLTGADTLEETLELRRQLTDLCTEAHSALGFQWHPRTDDFLFSTQQISITGFTKRSVLSLTARQFDPLGWLAPTVVSAKIAFQSTWLLQLGWDDTLEEDSVKFWQRFRDELPLLETIRVPRWVGALHTSLEVELHGFADASERVYASVVYLRSPEVGSWRVSLLAAKTKVAPIKPVTLLRLELCAAALLARLISQQRGALGFERAPSIAGRTPRTGPDALWHHIPGQENPADCASRGLLPGDLVKHELWWRGPAWLWLETSAWPEKTRCPDTTELPDARTRVHAAATTTLTDEEPAELLRFSSLNRLQRVTAWLRFRDSRGLLRVRGRLKHSLLDLEERHPIILPADSHFTLLIVEDCHRRSLHGVVQLTLSLVRQRYWVLRDRALAKRVIHRCVRGVRWRAAPAPQQMGDLPQERPPYDDSSSGVAYAVPCGATAAPPSSERMPVCASFFQHMDLNDALAAEGIRWRFNPPSASHFGPAANSGGRDFDL